MALSHRSGIALSGVSAISGIAKASIAAINGQTVGAGGGGSLSLTLLQQTTSSDGFGTGAYTPASFTPTAGRRLIVVIDAQSVSADALAGGDITITDSDSSITSWTAIIASTTHPGSWGYGTRAFVSDQGASGASMTVSADCGAFSVENYRVTVWEVENYGGIGGTAVGSDSGGGAASITLSQAPLTSSIVIGAINVTLSGGTSSATEGADFTEVTSSDVTRTDWWNFQKQARTGSTSTTVGWQDTTTGGTALGCTLIAFEILQA